MAYLDNDNFASEDRRNHAFQAINAVREAVTLAKGTSLPITYERAFDLIEDLDPKLYESITKLLTSKNESETVKYYKEMAEIKSTPEKKIEPNDLIQKDIDSHEELIGDTSFTNNRFIAKKIFELRSAREYFKPRQISEHKVLNQDFYLRSISSFDEPIYKNDNYKDYKIGKNKFLRLRLLHPDKDEEVLGVDLVYEQFDLQREQVRFVHLQYKMWNANTLYFSQSKNLLPQLDKIESNLCKSGYCRGPEHGKRDKYRFPYCSGFLRPTSRIAQEDSKLISTGLHVPICLVREIQQANTKLTKDNCAEKSLSSKIFEELFNSNLIGSRWIPISELDQFYEQKGLNSYSNRIRVHAQEVDVEYDIDKKRDES
ncbi:hypothetical protein OB69_04930 [Roseivirga seohaensis subsp. aquiponti]|uniref:Uncharacterized protein n=1 Tax=Roseivirga seohaensis subsp. aquiponti TaxID=1566026 RepID=A0A0L8AN49_9BACT|nr:hypothetical protein [Roseivirga seohaensis]KOF03645.1 hypothetical protein OB69_04930 [Roseivirga seohaensis subsp. aquiponti]